MKQDCKIEIIVATMNQNDFSKVNEMGITSDVVFANQTDETSYSEENYGTFTAKMISTNTRGVGINRNLGLQYATGDILLIADDDMVYSKDYMGIVKKAFEQIPDADAFIFNIETKGVDMGRRKNNKISRVHIHNCLNYGAARIAVRRQSLLKNRISFSTCFGGGTIYSSGEDSLFICDMLRKGFKIYTYPETIAVVDQTTSTWFNGYNEKFFYDKGAFFNAVFGKVTPLMCLQYVLRHKNVCEKANMSIPQILKLMSKGAKGYKNLYKWK